MSDNSVLGIGELLWDCFGHSQRPGGAPANVAFHATQLGVKGVVCSRVGYDELGNALIEHLRARGIDGRTIQRDPDHPTGTVTVNIADGDHPTYEIHEGVAWDNMVFDAAFEGAARSASAVCFGTLAQRTPATRKTIELCLDASQGALLVYDVNLRPPWFTREIIEASLRRCDVAKLSDAEAPVLGRMLGLPAARSSDFAAALRERYGIGIVCLTRGPDGCFVVSDDTRVDVPGRPVEVIDAVGAGDAFTAALVCGLLWRWPLDKVARFANEVGALVASRPGAMPSLGRELAEVIARAR
ncbi:MAG: carbohydrate kinase [Phycisphaerae bacterium]